MVEQAKQPERVNIGNNSLKEALVTSYDNCIEVKQAKAVKLNTCKDLKVYEKVQNQVQRFVTTVWAVIEKYKERIRVTKACLVWLEASRKMIEIDLEKICQYVVKKASDCCFLFWFSMGGKYINWTSNQQYLQGKQVTHNLFIKLSKEVETDQMWKLKKIVYGVTNPSRAWYLHVKKISRNWCSSKQVR